MKSKTDFVKIWEIAKKNAALANKKQDGESKAPHEFLIDAWNQVTEFDETSKGEKNE